MKLRLKLPFSKGTKDTALGIIVGVGIIGIVGFLIFRLIQRNTGFFSYAGLTPNDIDYTAKELDSRCKILSRVQKGNKFRGIYLGSKDGSGACSMPLYYHYTPGKEYEIYPLLWNELWTTNKDLLGLTGRMVY